MTKQRIKIIPGVPDAPWFASGPFNSVFPGAGEYDTEGKYDVAPGDYTIRWGDIPGLITPLPMTIRVSEGSSATFFGLYSRLLKETESPWKISGLTMTKHGLVGCIYHDNTRANSKMLLQTPVGQVLLHVSDAETLAQAVEHGESLLFPGECRNVISWHPSPAPKGTITTHRKVKWCICIENLDGEPWAFDTASDRTVSAINLVSGLSIPMPGDGVINMAVSHNGKFYGAMCNSDSKKFNGISCSDGSFHRLPDCRCIISAAGRVIYSSLNEIIDMTAGHLRLVTLPCEKATHMHVYLGHLWIAGVNPDSIYIMSPDGALYQLYEFPGGVEMGDSVFGPRVTSGYFSINPGLRRGAAYEILIPPAAIASKKLFSLDAV